MVKETITLFYREGSSDKFYTASIEEVSGGKFLVPFVFGRRGTSGQSGDKLKGVPSSYEKAKAAYDEVVSEKIAKGYKPGAGIAHAGVAAAAMAKVEAKPSTGINCQLLNPITEDEMEACLKDPTFCAQEKFDGKRLIIKVTSDYIIAINRKGIECGFPAEIEADLKLLRRESKKDFTLDGEAVGSLYCAFDLLSIDGKDIGAQSYKQRYAALQKLIFGLHEEIDLESVMVAILAVSENDKRNLLSGLRTKNREGIVFKRLDAPYKAGRPNSGGDQLKFKFYSTASCVVMKVNAKNSVAVAVLDDKEDLLPVGNCTIPTGKKIPSPDDIVEIRYLYAYPKGSLYQPVFLGVRDDLGISDCSIKQLKYKSAGAEEE